MLDDPIAVYPSATRNDAYLAILRATDNDGKIVVAAIKPDSKSNYNNVVIDTNFILSAYGRNRVIRYFDKVLNNLTPIYPKGITKKEVVERTLGLQLSNGYLLPSSIISQTMKEMSIKIQ